MKRICFLFNHDQTHQLAHSLPIAVQMLAQGDHQIVLAYSSDVIGQELARLGGAALAGASMVRLGVKSSIARLAAKVLDRTVPATKALLYRDNLDFFRSFDALVVSEKRRCCSRRDMGSTAQRSSIRGTEPGTAPSGSTGRARCSIWCWCQGRRSVSGSSGRQGLRRTGS